MLQETTIQEAIDEMGLPKNAKFAGYVVHWQENDEFLAAVEDSGDIENRMWSKVPDLAMIFHDHRFARREAISHDRGAIVALLFDVDDQYYVVPQE